MQVVVEESVQQLCSLVLAGTWDCNAAQDTLLAALQAADGEGIASSLVEGIVALYGRDDVAALCLADLTLANLDWRSHPLSKALLANPGGWTQLLLASGRLIISAAARAPSEREAMLRRLMPFISFALLDLSASSSSAAGTHLSLSAFEGFKSHP